MAHLHETWWQEVQLLTIAHLGSGKKGASKASALILTILNVYTPPSWILRSSGNRWLRLIGPGKLLPQVQLGRRIAWIQAREFELATKGYMECILGGTTAKVGTILSAHAAALVRHILYDDDRSEQQKALLTVACQMSQRQGNEKVVSSLLAALRDVNVDVRVHVIASLDKMGVSNETVVSSLLELLDDEDLDVQMRTTASLGQVGVGNETVVSALLELLRDADGNVRRQATASLGQVGIKDLIEAWS